MNGGMIAWIESEEYFLAVCMNAMMNHVKRTVFKLLKNPRKIVPAK